MLVLKKLVIFCNEKVKVKELFPQISLQNPTNFLISEPSTFSKALFLLESRFTAGDVYQYQSISIHHLARLFTSSIQIGYIPTAWKLATLRMLLKPDKLPSLTTSYRPISLISSIMKLFERVIEQRLRSYLEDIGFINKYQSGFRQHKSTDDHLFRFSQSVMESFNRREHVVAAFLDVEKAFDNVWHNGLRYKIFMLDLPTKMTRWLSDFLVGRVIQVNVNGFLSDQINPAAGVPQGSVLSPLLFLIYVNDLPKPHHRQNSKSQFADDTALWAASRNVHIAAKLLQKDLRKLAKWCAKWRIKLNPKKPRSSYSPGPTSPEIQNPL